MSGSSSVRGDQTIYHTDNLCFDGTDRGSPMAADGQLWIGATASNRADNGGHVRLGSLTAGTGMVVTNGAGSITLSTTASLTDLHAPRFIVASSTLGTGANFTTIAAAIASAQGTGINSTIFLQPGTYTENVTLVPGINLCAFDCDAFTPNVTIVGTLTLTTAGSVSISGIRLQTNSAPLLAVTGSAASVVILTQCNINCTNNTGITFSSSSASSSISFRQCRGDLGTTGIGLFAHSSSGSMSFASCSFTNSGSSLTASTCSAGTLDFGFSQFLSAITMSGTSAGTWEHGFIVTSSLNITCATLGGSGAMAIKWLRLQSGTAAAISISTTAFLEFCNIISTNTNAITGAGTLNYSHLMFESSSSTMNTTTQVPFVTSNDAINVTTPGAYPYTTVPQDAIILVDSSAARSIVPLASPTTGQKHIIKDNAGTAAANNITVTPSGKNIDGAASFTMNTNYGSLTIVYNGTKWNVV